MDIDDVLEALEDYREAKEELKQREAEYTGYSPSWALASWIECRDKARGRVDAALREYILSVTEASHD